MVRVRVLLLRPNYKEENTTMYIANDWVIIQAVEGYYKLLASIGRGLPNWRMNSGITNIVDNGETLQVIGCSGSVYTIRRDAEGVSPTTEHIIAQLAKYNLAKVVPLSEVNSSNFI